MKTNLEFLMRFSQHTLLLLLCYFLNVSLTYGNEGPYVYSVVGTGAALAISAGVQALGAGANAFAQGRMNRKTRQWNEKMYAQQRADALSDWQMQNEYNSPQQQMQRLKDAGLNPNLVYGNGAEAMSQSDVRSSEKGNWNPQTPDYSSFGTSALSGALGYLDMKAKSAQTDNIKVQNEQLQEQVRAMRMQNAANGLTYLTEAAAKNATNKGIIGTAGQKAQQELYNLMAQGDVFDATASDITQSFMLKGTQYNTEFVRRKNMVDDNTRQWIASAQNVKESSARIVSMAVANAKSQEEVKEIEQAVISRKFQNFQSYLEYKATKNFPGGKWGVNTAVDVGGKLFDKLSDLVPSVKSARTIIQSPKGRTVIQSTEKKRY